MTVTVILNYRCKYNDGYVEWENNYLIPCWFCTFAHWQRNDQSIISMVGLFEQWETEKQQQNPEKRIKKKL